MGHLVERGTAVGVYTRDGVFLCLVVFRLASHFRFHVRFQIHTTTRKKCCGGGWNVGHTSPFLRTYQYHAAAGIEKTLWAWLGAGIDDEPLTFCAQVLGLEYFSNILVFWGQCFLKF